MCITVAKVGQCGPKTNTVAAVLPNTNVLGQVIGVLEPENRKVGQGVLTFFANVKVTYTIYP